MVVLERLSTDIEWWVEIQCSHDDRSGTSENFVIFSYLSLCFSISMFLKYSGQFTL